LGDITLLGLPISLGTMIYQAFIFTVLVLILKKLVFKKLVAVLENRKSHIQNQLQLTEQFKIEAERNLVMSEQVLKQAKSDAREIRRRTESEAKLIIQSAKEEAKQILKKANTDAFPAHSLSFSHTEQIKGA
jgi:F0F1-type ATP synthase membrane subunit b/b'